MSARSVEEVALEIGARNIELAAENHDLKTEIATQQQCATEAQSLIEFWEGLAKERQAVIDAVRAIEPKKIPPHAVGMSEKGLAGSDK